MRDYLGGGGGGLVPKFGRFLVILVLFKLRAVKRGHKLPSKKSAQRGIIQMAAKYLRILRPRKKGGGGRVGNQ